MRVLFIALILAMGAAGSTRAAITYTYVTDVSGTGTSAGTSGSYGGSSVTVNLYLDEAITGGSQAIIGPGGSEAGLFSAGIAVNLTGGNAKIVSAALNTNSAAGSGSGIGPSNSPGFGTANSYESTNVASNGSNAAILDTLVPGSGSAPKAVTISNSGGTIVNQIYLGSVTIQGGTQASTFSVTSFNNSTNQLAQTNGDSTETTPNGSFLDVDGTSSAGVSYSGTEDTSSAFTVSAAAVPEPSSVVLTGLVFAGIGVGAYRRAKSAKAEAVASSC